MTAECAGRKNALGRKMLPGAKGGRWRRIRFKNLDSPVIIFSEHRAPTILQALAPPKRLRAPHRNPRGHTDTIYSQSAPDPGAEVDLGKKGTRGPHSFRADTKGAAVDRLGPCVALTGTPAAELSPRCGSSSPQRDPSYRPSVRTS